MPSMLLMLYDLANPTCNSVQQADHMQSHMLLIYPTPTECRPQIKMMMYDYTTINMVLVKAILHGFLKSRAHSTPQRPTANPDTSPK
jgi:hypothetical protein